MILPSLLATYLGAGAAAHIATRVVVSIAQRVVADRVRQRASQRAADGLREWLETNHPDVLAEAQQGPRAIRET